MLRKAITAVCNPVSPTSVPVVRACGHLNAREIEMPLTVEKGLVFHPNQYVYGVWFVPGNLAKPLEDRCDWLCCQWRELDEPLWYIRYRFRYPKSPDPWANVDERAWMTFTRPGTDRAEDVAMGLHQMAQVVALRFETDVCFVPMGCDGERALTLLAAQPWMHLKEVPHGITD